MLKTKKGICKKASRNGVGTVSRKVTDLQPWECLMKRIVWKQLGDIRNKKILDFGSGIGVTANYLAEHNDVTAIEPDEDSIKERWADHQYTQIVGSTEELREFDDETFDMIICHNVLEYAEDRPDIVKEFARILKSNGKISIVKHNRAGRVMQMVVLLNDLNMPIACLMVMMEWLPSMEQFTIMRMQILRNGVRNL